MSIQPLYSQQLPTHAGPAVLSSWKEIAQYFGKGVRTVQRWERNLELPVTRPEAASQNIVFARVSDLENWLSRRAHRPSKENVKVHYEGLMRMRVLLTELAGHAARLQSNMNMAAEHCAVAKERQERARLLRDQRLAQNRSGGGEALDLVENRRALMPPTQNAATPPAA